MRFKSSFWLLGVVAANYAMSEAAPVRKIVPKGAVSFTSKAGGFAVWLPNKPRVKFEVGTVKKEKIPTYSAVVSTQAITYMILAFGNPASVRRQTAKHRFDEARKSYLKKKEITLQRETDFRLGDILGREFEISFDRPGDGVQMVGRNRHYFTKRTYFWLTATGSQMDMQTQAAQITRVFDSFRILPQK